MSARLFDLFTFSVARELGFDRDAARGLAAQQWRRYRPRRERALRSHVVAMRSVAKSTIAREVAEALEIREGQDG